MSHTPDMATKRGRPPSEKKRQQILLAAIELFTLNGYDGTSVDDIASSAGVSKQTVYSHFGNKENLFGLAVSTKCRESGMGTDGINMEEPPEHMLPEVAKRVLRLITSPEATRIHAVCTVSADTHPELGRIYFEHGALQAVNAVAEYLESQDKAGKLRIDNPRNAAWQFLGMLKAEEHLRTQFNIGNVDPDELQAYIDDCVAMFIRAYANRSC